MTPHKRIMQREEQKRKEMLDADFWNLPTRVQNVLINANIRSVEILSFFTVSEFRRLRNAGTFAIRHLENILKERGMSFTPDPPKTQPKICECCGQRIKTKRKNGNATKDQDC